jgi:phosphatidylglycerophosphate synthase
VTPVLAEALLPLIGVLTLLVATLAVFSARVAIFGRQPEPYVAGRPRSFLAKFLQEWWIWLFRPIERVCIGVHVPPDGITIASTLVAALAAALLALGHLSLGGWVYLFSASLDFVDGRVARASGRATKAGAFLDSTLDRVSELLVLGGLAVAFRRSPALYAALGAAGASLVFSYARARGEALGAGESARAGGMQRPERVVVTGVACALSPLAEALRAGGGRLLVGSALTVLAVLTTATAARRVHSIYRALARREPPPVRRASRLAAVLRLDAAHRRGAAP